MKRFLITATSVVMAAAGLSACGGGGDDSSSIKIGFIAGAAAPVPDVIAEELGFFEDHGLEVQKVNTTNGPGLVTLLLSGGVDVTWAPTSNVLAASDKVSIVAGNVRSYGFELVQRVGYDDDAAKKEFPASVEGLKGAKIGVSAAGSFGQVEAEYILEKAGVNPDDVTFIGVGVEGTSLGALKSKQIDVLMAGTIASAKAEVEGIGTTLVSTLDIPELATLPESVYAIQKKADSGTRDKTARYLAAIQDAMDWAHDPANAKELGEVLTKHFKLEGPAAELISTEWSPEGKNVIGEYRQDIDPASYARLVDILVESGLLKKSVAFDDVVDLIEPK